MTNRNFAQLLNEHRILLNSHGEAQTRCSDIIARQAEENRALQAELMRLRAEVIRRDTLIAFLRADRAELEQAIPGLPTRLTLARKVSALIARVQDLLRERNGLSLRSAREHQWVREQSSMLSRLDARSVLCIGPDQAAAAFTRRLVEMAGGSFAHDPVDQNVDPVRLEASVRAVDLVICQAGCVSHNAYWRVRDYCKRTGKPCLLVESPSPAASGDA